MRASLEALAEAVDLIFGVVVVDGGPDEGVQVPVFHGQQGRARRGDGGVDGLPREPPGYVLGSLALYAEGDDDTSVLPINVGGQNAICIRQ